MQVLTRAGQDVSFTDVKIKIPGPEDVNDFMHRKRARRIWGDLKKSVELRTTHRTRSVDFRGSQRPDEFVRYGRRTRWGADRKSSIEILCPSPYVEEPLNSKVIKSFVPELRSRVFRVSGFLCSMYICYEHSMYVSHIHIWLLYKCFNPKRTMFIIPYHYHLISENLEYTDCIPC